jgi:hypothetical protein
MPHKEYIVNKEDDRVAAATCYSDTNREAFSMMERIALITGITLFLRHRSCRLFVPSSPRKGITLRFPPRRSHRSHQYRPHRAGNRTQRESIISWLKVTSRCRSRRPIIWRTRTVLARFGSSRSSTGAAHSEKLSSRARSISVKRCRRSPRRSVEGPIEVWLAPHCLIRL